jgi:hypothetical protein
MTRLMHEGSSVESRGPWSFSMVRDDELAADAEGLVRRELPCGLTMITKAGGTCDRCMRAITYIVILGNQSGDTVHVGADCAEYLLADEEGRQMIRRANAELRAALRHERRMLAIEEARKANASRQVDRNAARAAELAAYRAEMATHLDRAHLVLSAAKPGSYAHTIVSKFVSHIDALQMPPAWAWEGLERFYARAQRPSKPVGTVGERVVVEGFVTRVFCLERTPGAPRWNTKYLVEVTTDEGDVVILFAFWRVVLDNPLVPGDKITMSVEIREHKPTGTTVGDFDTVVTKPRAIAQVAQHIPTWHPAFIEEIQ